MDWLIYSAKNYQLAGKPFGELCDHNARVAMDLGRHQVNGRLNLRKNIVFPLRYMFYIVLTTFYIIPIDIIDLEYVEAAV